MHEGFTKSLHELSLRALGEVGMRLCGVARLDGVGEMHGDVAVDVPELADHGRHVGDFGMRGNGVVETLWKKVRDGLDG